MRPTTIAFLVTLGFVLTQGCGDDDHSGGSSRCDPLPVPTAATGVLGPQEDGEYPGHNGRAAGGIGSSILLDAVSQGFVVHPTRPLAFVSSYGRDGAGFKSSTPRPARSCRGKLASSRKAKRFCRPTAIVCSFRSARGGVSSASTSLPTAC